MSKMAVDLNSCLNMGLSMEMKMHRRAEELCKARGEEEKMSAVVFGASNGGQLAEVLKEKGVNVSCAATPGWRLAGHRVKEMAEMAGRMGKDEVLVLYGLDASVFLDVVTTCGAGPRDWVRMADTICEVSSPL